MKVSEIRANCVCACHSRDLNLTPQWHLDDCSLTEHNCRLMCEAKISRNKMPFSVANKWRFLKKENCSLVFSFLHRTLGCLCIHLCADPLCLRSPSRSWKNKDRWTFECKPQGRVNPMSQFKAMAKYDNSIICSAQLWCVHVTFETSQICLQSVWLSPWFTWLVPLIIKSTTKSYQVLQCRLVSYRQIESLALTLYTQTRPRVGLKKLQIWNFICSLQTQLKDKIPTSLQHLLEVVFVFTESWQESRQPPIRSTNRYFVCWVLIKGK